MWAWMGGGRKRLLRSCQAGLGFSWPMPLARAEWEAGLSADAVLQDQWFTRALSLKTREGENRGWVKGVVVKQG